MDTFDWQKRRTQFNHDWLKNTYLPASGTFLNILQGVVDDTELAQRFLSHLVPQLKLRMSEARLLIATLPDAMSPKCLFQSPPLLRCDDQTQNWLPNLAHTLWKSRLLVTQITENANRCIDRLLSTHARVERILSDSGSLEVLRRSKSDFIVLDDACRALASAFEEFPSHIQIT